MKPSKPSPEAVTTQKHFAGTAKCKYTRSFKPLSVAQCWHIDGDKRLAMKVENYIKKLNKQEKENLILFPEQLTTLFPCKPISLS